MHLPKTLSCIFISVTFSCAYQSDDRIAPGISPTHYQNQPSDNTRPGPVVTAGEPQQHYEQHDSAHQRVAPGIPQNQYHHYQDTLAQREAPGVGVPSFQDQNHKNQDFKQHTVPGVPLVMHQTGALNDIAGEQEEDNPDDSSENTLDHDHDAALLLNTSNIVNEREHIQEHMDVPIDTSKMSEKELQFHYFKMHDADKNKMLDGCELIKSLLHWHEENQKNDTKPRKVFTDDELANLIDPILKQDDKNGDGYIDYGEFILAQEKSHPK